MLDEFDEPPLDYFWLTTMQVVGQLAVGLGPARRSRPHLRRAPAPTAGSSGITASGSLCLGLVATTLGELALALGDDAAAVELLQPAVVRADAMGAPFEATKGRRLLATALARTGRPTAEVVATGLALARQHGFTEEERLLTDLA